MGEPVATKYQGKHGRRSSARYHVKWTAADTVDKTADKVLDLTEASAYWESPRFGVYDIEWSKSAAVRATLYFDSFPPEDGGWVTELTPGATSGEEDFTRDPSGCIMDPNSDSPGNLVITTEDAADDEEIFISMRFKTKGTTHPQGTTRG